MTSLGTASAFPAIQQSSVFTQLTALRLTAGTAGTGVKRVQLVAGGPVQRRISAAPLSTFPTAQQSFVPTQNTLLSCAFTAGDAAGPLAQPGPPVQRAISAFPPNGAPTAQQSLLAAQCTPNRSALATLLLSSAQVDVAPSYFTVKGRLPPP